VCAVSTQRRRLLRPSSPPCNRAASPDKYKPASKVINNIPYTITYHGTAQSNSEHSDRRRALNTSSLVTSSTEASFPPRRHLLITEYRTTDRQHHRRYRNHQSLSSFDLSLDTFHPPVRDLLVLKNVEGLKLRQGTQQRQRESRCGRRRAQGTIFQGN